MTHIDGKSFRFIILANDFTVSVRDNNVITIKYGRSL